MPIFAHRENHGEGCGFTVKLKATDTNLNEKVEVRELADWQLTEFAEAYIHANCNLDSIIYLVIESEPIVRMLKSLVDNPFVPMTKERKDFILDANLYFEENWDKSFPATVSVVA